MNKEKYEAKKAKLMNKGLNVFCADAVLLNDAKITALAKASLTGTLDDMQKFVSICNLYRDAKNIDYQQEVYNDDGFSTSL